MNEYRLIKSFTKDNRPDIAESMTIAVTLGIQVFLPCYYGSELEYNCQALLNDLMETNVMDVDSRYRMDLSIFQLNLMSPMRINALIIFPVNLNIFLRVNNQNLLHYQCDNYYTIPDHKCDLLDVCSLEECNQLRTKTELIKVSPLINENDLNIWTYLLIFRFSKISQHTLRSFSQFESLNLNLNWIVKWLYLKFYRNIYETM